MLTKIGERETTITLSDGDTLVRIWTSQHHVIQHLRKDKRFTETTDPSRCTTEEAEFTIPRTEWTPWGGAKHRRQLTDEQQIMEQVAADIWEYWDACGDLIDDRDHFPDATRFLEVTCDADTFMPIDASKIKTAQAYVLRKPMCCGTPLKEDK